MHALVYQGRGAGAVIETVGIPATFQPCQNVVVPGGRLPRWANMARAADTRALKVIIEA
ncbi:hypothetical protein [Klebsiella pneumoniae]|uniref:hypothetical protein n=1 Tax=Klebsiella pneumoniae TaxID=573 RepID=UPI002108F02B|nr:hypothetical protein [Klebsiella pneumoniae]